MNQINSIGLNWNKLDWIDELKQIGSKWSNVNGLIGPWNFSSLFFFWIFEFDSIKMFNFEISFNLSSILN